MPDIYLVFALSFLLLNPFLAFVLNIYDFSTILIPVATLFSLYAGITARIGRNIPRYAYLTLIISTVYVLAAGYVVYILQLPKIFLRLILPLTYYIPNLITSIPLYKWIKQKLK